MEPRVEIEDFGAGAEAMIGCEEDRSLWASHGYGVGDQSIQLPEVVETEISYASFPG
jgi:hypothetical protein